MMDITEDKHPIFNVIYMFFFSLSFYSYHQEFSKSLFRIWKIKLLVEDIKSFPMLQESFQLEFSTKSYDISKFGKNFKF